MCERLKPETKVSIVPTIGGALIALVKDSEEPKIYKVRDTVLSCDKGGHKERSIVNQPNHLKHKKNTP